MALQSVCGRRGCGTDCDGSPKVAEQRGYLRLTTDRTLPAVLVDILHRIGDGADILSILILDLEVELLLHRHDDFNQVERIGVQIADELGVHRYFVFVDAEPVGDDYANSLKRRCHPRSSPPYAVRRGRAGSTETLPSGPAAGYTVQTRPTKTAIERAFGRMDLTAAMIHPRLQPDHAREPRKFSCRDSSGTSRPRGGAPRESCAARR